MVWKKTKKMIDFNLPYFQYIKTKLNKVDYNKYIESFKNDNYKCIRVNHLKKKCFNSLFRDNEKFKFEDAYYINNDQKYGNIIFHELGGFYVQEPSAMIPVTVLSPKPNTKVLDLCAAPGSKSTQIASNMSNSGLLVCNEINRGRAQVLYENIKRLGITNAIILNMHPKQLEDCFFEYFDQILVDAPCSGEGMFRKYPDTIKGWTIENVNSCSDRQSEILKSALKMLKPGGKIIYSTCTLNEVENENNVTSLLNDDNLYLEDFELNNEYCSKNGMLKLSPINFKGEGQFIAQIYKKNSYGFNVDLPRNHKNLLRKPSSLELKKFNDFCSLNNIKNVVPNYVYNNILMQIPDISIDILSNLNIINAGLRLGEIKYNMFIPDFSFARSICNLNNVRNIELDLDQAIKYISGESISVENYNYEGFILLSYHGYSISWGKIKNGIIKNHYPKYIRKKLFKHL